MNEEKSFLDSRTVIAIVLVAVIWLGWQMHLSKKYPSTGEVAKVAEPATQAAQVCTAADAEAGICKTPAVSNAIVPAVKLPQKNLEETLAKYEDDTWSFDISSKGMSLRNVVLKKYTDREGHPIILANEFLAGEFQTTLIGPNTAPDFVVKVEGNRIFGFAEANGLKIEKEYIVNSAQYTLDTKVAVSGSAQGVQGISLNMSDKVEQPTSSGFLMPSTDHHSLFVAHGTTSKHENLSHKGEGKIGETYSNVSVVALGSLYFTKALVDTSDIQPQFEAGYEKTTDGQLYAKGKLNYVFPAGTSGANLKMKTFAGPKDLSLLNAIDPKLEGAVDYWVLSAIAKPMLKLMKWLHSVFGNWGVAIILLTLIVRSLVLPLYMASFKSTKAMQRIQPEMKRIREKHKDNPQVMNAEVMRLFKENKVNPLGGCLPMLLQFPIFIALYRVLSQSIELYQAPFAFWIHDLSVKDPYYVIPVLMGIAMFFQQKVTPMTTADPAQQKVMMFMPILFSFMMLSLPSGLTLYILVSTLFGITQQLIFIKDRSNKLVTAKA